MKINDLFEKVSVRPYSEGPTSTYESNGILYRLDVLFKLVSKRKPSTIAVDRLKWILPFTTTYENRVKSADIKAPLLVHLTKNGMAKNDDVLIVVDGAHRLMKAINEHTKELPCYLLSDEDMELARIN